MIKGLIKFFNEHDSVFGFLFSCVILTCLVIFCIAMLLACPILIPLGIIGAISGKSLCFCSHED